MRAGCELDSREAGDLYFGDIVKVIDEGMASNGARRVRVEAPSGAKGWVSAKMLEESADVLDASGGAHKLTVQWQEEGTTLKSIPLEVPADATVADVKRSLQAITQVRARAARSRVWGRGSDHVGERETRAAGPVDGPEPLVPRRRDGRSGLHLVRGQGESARAARARSPPFARACVREMASLQGALIMTAKAGATPAADAPATGGHAAVGRAPEDGPSGGGLARPVAGHMSGRAAASNARTARAMGSADDDDDDEDLTKEAEDEELEVRDFWERGGRVSPSPDASARPRMTRRAPPQAPIVEEVDDGAEAGGGAPPAPKKRKRMWMFIVYHGDKAARRLPHSVRPKCPRNGTWEQAIDGLALVKATFVERYNAVHAKRPLAAEDVHLVDRFGNAIADDDVLALYATRGGLLHLVNGRAPPGRRARSCSCGATTRSTRPSCSRRRGSRSSTASA